MNYANTNPSANTEPELPEETLKALHELGEILRPIAERLVASGEFEWQGVPSKRRLVKIEKREQGAS